MTTVTTVRAALSTRSSRQWFAAAVVGALLAALAAWTLWSGGASFGWFAYTPLSSGQPAEAELARAAGSPGVVLGLLLVACVLLARSAWLAARQASTPDGPGSRAAAPFVWLSVVIAIGSMLASAFLQLWTAGAVVATPLGPRVLVTWLEPSLAGTAERVLVGLDAARAVAVLQWFGVVSLLCAVALLVAVRRDRSPLRPRPQPEA